MRVTVVAAALLVSVVQVTDAACAVGGSATITKLGDALNAKIGTISSINNALSAPYLVVVAGQLGGKGYYTAAQLKC
ncbi:Aste57867_19833 [Aphanomyces stellatus]|uniref:Aste57867_19833 protein n=1 Tax=Aphanomyces stellatus TaxID=120398 RepID=A0A485LI62_9STRA|nr:hypothetical protein As57867_019768 [Aphanomyces stellatus]VFT96531.1 Aste57867_19833 [Aphanomyces stellatus]